MILEQIKIGMRVLCKGEASYVDGKKGTVKEIRDISWIGVEFDVGDRMFHNLNGLSPARQGYYVHASSLRPLDDFIENWEDIPNQVKNK